MRSARSPICPPNRRGGRKDLGPATGWYAVGVILFELMTGRIPFDGPALRVIVDKQQLRAPRAKDLCADIPDELDELCAALLETDAVQRLLGASVDQFIGELVKGSQSGSRSHSSMSQGATHHFRGREVELSALSSPSGATRPPSPKSG